MKRILVAEDEDVIRDFVVINLRRSGYEVVDVPNGDEAHCGCSTKTTAILTSACWTS